MKNNLNLIIENVPFIRNDQYNFIKSQIKNLVRAHSTTKDKDVLNALRLSSLDKIFAILPDTNENQKVLLNQAVSIQEDFQADSFLAELKYYVIPFRNVTESTITKLFPKAKKIKVPPLEAIDFRDLSYLGWYDIRSEKKFLIVENNGKLKGIQGTFKESIKGICSICNGHEDVGMFLSKLKTGTETYTNRGNYICRDSHKCNQNLITLDKLNNFVELLSK